MNDRLRLKVAIMAICFVSLISKGIVLERLTHKNDLLDVYPSFNIQNVDIKKTELEESLKMIMDKAALSKYFKNFSIQFVKTNYCKEPIIIVIDLRSVFENKEKPIGLYCSDHQQYFFIKEDSNRLWEKYFSYSGSEESVELRQIIVPDSVYIMEPDVSFVCVAKIEGNLCKILYCEIDGKIDGKIDEAATTTEGTQPYKYSTKELDRENGLDWYDNKARMYDPTIGRTPTLDPMAEKYYSLSPYAWCAGNPIRLVDLDGKDPIYAKKGFLFWKHVELIGDDGKQSSNSYLVRGNVQKNVGAATKNGEKYNGDLSESNDVILIPTGQLLNDVIQSVNDTKASGKENGGHAYSGDNNATRWDEGSYATQEIQENATITKASLSPFVVGGNNVEPKDASNLKIWWHVHPKVTIGEATLGNSIPSENDKNFQTKMQSRGYTGNTFVIGAGSNTVTFFNKRTLMTVS